MGLCIVAWGMEQGARRRTVNNADYDTPLKKMLDDRSVLGYKAGLSMHNGHGVGIA